MKVLILAAGYGTRLFELGKDTPKPLFAFNGKPIIDYLLSKVQDVSNLNEIIVITNDKFFSVFEVWANNNKNFPIPINIINDGTRSPEERLGSIGDINFFLKRNRINEDLLVIGGDNLFDFGLEEYITFSQDNSPSATIGLYDIKEVSKSKSFGVVTLDEEKKVVFFEEKPQNPKSSLIAMCLYYFPRGTLGFFHDYLNNTRSADTTGDYIRWLYQREAVFGFTFTGKWYDIGSVEAYHTAQENFQ